MLARPPQADGTPLLVFGSPKLQWVSYRLGQLLRFFVQSFLFAEFAEFLQFQTLGGIFFILLGLVIQIMANRAFQVYEIILGHNQI